MRYVVPSILALMLVMVSSSPLPNASAGGEPPAVRASFIETGYGFTCAVITDGSVQCWGENSAGQLGDGSEETRLAPTPVIGLAGPVELVALADAHACALYESGGVGCWGYNGDGELGDGTGVDSPTPVAVSDLSAGVIDLASGELHTCAVISSGATNCWGFNVAGQLGDGTETDRHEPVEVVGLNNAVQIDGAEDDFTCAVTTAAAAKCWGHNESGHLGNGTTENSSVPVQVSGLGSDVEAVSAGGDHACALMIDRTMRCWSRNYEGQLGIGTKDAGSLTPVEVNDLIAVEEISAGAHHTCAVTDAGDVYCWGLNSNGQLGDGTNANRDEPQRITTIDNIVHIAAGYYHTCAVDEDGRVFCWGAGNRGQLGTGTLDASNEPVEVTLAKPPAGSERIWGDDDCDGDVDSVDSLKNLRFVAALSVSQEKGCPAFAMTVDVAGASPHPWGDVDCDEDVDSVDALKILRHVAALSVVQPKGCPAIGSSVTVTP